MSLNQVEILLYIQSWLNHYWAQRGKVSFEVTPETNLIASGAIDSLSFVTLVGAIEDKFSIEIDFGQVSPSALSTIGGLTALCVKTGT